MSLAKKIYFSPVGYLISVVMYLFGLLSGPFMIYGYRNRVTKKFLKGVRISSSAVITNKNGLNVGDNVWIGGGCIILAGVTIGENSVIGAGSIVTHSIPANCVAVGSPCRVIRSFESELSQGNI